MHVGGVLVLEKPGGGVEALAELISARLSLVPRYRQRVVEGPGHLANAGLGRRWMSTSPTTAAGLGCLGSRLFTRWEPSPVAEPATPSGTGPQLAVKGLDAPKTSPDQLSYSAPTLDASPKESGPAKAAKSATVTGTKETPRNAPCPCGSGKKYKQCHGAPGR